MFPEQDTFIPNIMKFCGYLTRNSILKLKNESEVQKMFEYVVKMAELIPDKQAMFGIFAPKPTLLSEMGMPPGTWSTFERFLDRVDKLLPKPVKLKSRKTTKSPSVSSTAPRTANRQPSAQTEHPTATIESVKERFEKWFRDELKNVPRIKTTVEEAMKTFTLTENPNGGFTWRCQNKSHAPQILQKSTINGNVPISNATRHLKNTCWMNATPNIRTNTTTSKPKLQVGISSFCTVTPPSGPACSTPAATVTTPTDPTAPLTPVRPPTSPIDISPEATHVKPPRTTKFSKIQFDIQSDYFSQNSKNLNPPAGLPESTDDSGR